MSPAECIHTTDGAEDQHVYEPSEQPAPYPVWPVVSLPSTLTLSKVWVRDLERREVFHGIASLEWDGISVRSESSPIVVKLSGMSSFNAYDATSRVEEQN